jgi:hypothetical protein
MNASVIRNQRRLQKNRGLVIERLLKSVPLSQYFDAVCTAAFIHKDGSFVYFA